MHIILFVELYVYKHRCISAEYKLQVVIIAMVCFPYVEFMSMV